MAKSIVDTMAHAGDVPWGKHGVKVTHNLSPEQMLKAAGLDWTVSKRLMFNEWGDEVKGHFLLTRDTDRAQLDIVGTKWKPVQNADSFDFFKKFATHGHMKMEHAGSLLGGRYVWALAHIDADFKLGKEDEVRSFVLLLSPHELGRAMVIQSLAMRTFCWNTLARLLRGGAFRMPHSLVFDDRMKRNAEIALGVATEQISEFREAVTLLSKKKARTDEVIDYFGEVCEIDRGAYDRANPKLKKDGTPIHPKLLTKCEEALIHAPGAAVSPAKGTWWGALNAVTYVIDHDLGKNRDTALRTAWFGNKARVKRAALRVALERAK